MPLLGNSPNVPLKISTLVAANVATKCPNSRKNRPTPSPPDDKVNLPDVGFRSDPMRLTRIVSASY